MFKSSQIETKRLLLALIFANLEIKDKSLNFTYRKPFDFIAEGFSYKLWRPLGESNSSFRIENPTS